jgi:hypothetical protein
LDLDFDLKDACLCLPSVWVALGFSCTVRCM